MKNGTLIAGAILLFALLGGGCAVTVHNHDHGYKPSHHDAAVVIWGEYYSCDVSTIRYLESCGYEDEDIFVFLSISYWSHKDVKLVVEEYRHRHSFFAVAMFYRIDPFLFYVDIDRRTHLDHPYGRAYGYYYKRSRSFTLTDAECRDLVSLRIFVEYYRYDVTTVVKWREQSNNNIVLMTEHYQDCGRGRNVRGGVVVVIKRPWEVKEHERERREDVEERERERREHEEDRAERERERQEEAREQEREHREEAEERQRERREREEERIREQRREEEKRAREREAKERELKERERREREEEERAREREREREEKRREEERRSIEDRKRAEEERARELDRKRQEEKKRSGDEEEDNNGKGKDKKKR